MTVTRTAMSASRARMLALPALVLIGLAVGAVARFTSTVERSEALWLATLALTGAPLVWRTVRGILAGKFAADLVASLAIVTAIILREPFAGLVIVLMQAGGEALELYAAGRASDAVRELEAEAPRVAHRREDDGRIIDVAAMDARVGDVLLVRPGELVPCDCIVMEGNSHVDASRVTGEPYPVPVSSNTRLLSGTANLESPLIVRVTAIATESQYERIVQLVRAAQESKSPLQRVADRYAVWFTPATLIACALAYAFSGDVTRVLAVLVVATPCPLILATPVAIVGGISRAARRGVIVRDGAALEALATVTAAVFDKTGTLTVGRPRVSRVRSVDALESNDLLQLAASIEQGSGHLLARTLVDEARERRVPLLTADAVREEPGQGVVGLVGRRRVAIGSEGFVLGQLDHDDARGALPSDRAALDAFAPHDGILRAYVALDGRFAGVVEYAEELRPGLTALFATLRGLGIRRTMLLSGDRMANVRTVADAVGIDEARGDVLAADKASVVRELAESGERVLMIGDGTNDAPALAEAAVGVALAMHGGGIAAEAADVVILADDVGRVADAITVGRHALRIARQSIWAGLTLSAVAMVIAAFGAIPPTVGALLQEGIDVAVILNALRAR